MKKLHLLMLCLAALAFCRCDDKRVTVGDLTVEMLENPVGLPVSGGSSAAICAT